MNSDIRAIINEMIAKKQNKLDNGPIDVTVDQLWKYSGKTEDDSKHYKQLIIEEKRCVYGAYKKSRKKPSPIPYNLKRRLKKII